MKRRDFIALCLGAAAWPLQARAQRTALPVIGFLSSASVTTQVPTAFREGLNEGGYFPSQNVAIEMRRAEGRYDRLSELATELVRRRVNVIVAAGGLASAQAAKAATATIPILFISGVDPVSVGLVASFNLPGGNATGVTVYTTELAAKRLELLREFAPATEVVAVLENPGTSISDIESKDLQAAALDEGLKLVVSRAGAEGELEKAFASAVERGASALLVSADPFFATRRDQIVALAARYALPAVYPWREYAEAGGLMSYGPSLMEAYRQIGRYAARILKGATPAELPVQLPRTFEFILNARTAKTLGLTVSRVMHARADKVID
jgi:putative tryptophan/tyrosine transport system substrate-binding protein